MKKSLIIFIAALLLVNVFFTVNAENTGFYLDLSSENITFSGDENAVVSYNGTPQIKSLTSFSGTKKYVDLRSGTVNIDSTAIKNLDKISVNLWFNLYDTKQKTLLSFEDEAGKSDFNVSYDGNGQLVYVVGYRNSKFQITKKASVSSAVNMWNNIVFTREWNSVSKRWSYTLYLNGALLVSEYAGGIQTSQDDMKLYIGGNTDKNNLGISDMYIFDEVLDALKVSNSYNANKESFSELSDTMNITEVLPKKGGAIKIDENHITVKFDNYINAEDADKYVEFVKENGEALGGSVFVKAKNKALDLYFGNLEPEENYILRFKEGLKSVNGISLEPCEFAFTAENDYIVNEDFSDDENYVVGEAPKTVGKIRYFSDGNWTASNMEVCETPDGDKYVSLKAGRADKDNFIDMTFDTPVTDKVIISDMKVRVYNVLNDNHVITTPNSLMRVYVNENAISPFSIVGESANGVFQGNTTQENLTYTTYRMSENTRDQNGFNSVRIIAAKNENGYYAMKMLDKNTDGSEYFLKTNNPNAIAVERITGLAATLLYPTGDDWETQIANDRYFLSDWKVYFAPEPKIIYVNADEITPMSESISVYLNDEAASESLSSDSIILRRKDTQKEIAVSVNGYDPKKRQVEIVPEECLDYGTEYEIILNGVKTKLGAKADNSAYSFKVGDRKLRVASNIFEKNAEGANISVSVTNDTEENKIIVLAAIVYNEANQAVCSYTKEFEVEKNSYSSSLLSLTNYSEKGGKNVKLFVMEAADGGLYSISAEEYSYNLY